MKGMLLLILIGLFLICCSEEPSSSDEFYKLTISVLGRGSYDVFPDKSEYTNGESVTITAYADSGWKFRRWEGNILSNVNPLQLNMNGDKTIRVVFGIPFEPDVTGSWAGVEFAVTFHIIQPDIFDSTLSGTLLIESISGIILEYTVSGYNRSPLVYMECSKSGYYPLTYRGWWANSSSLDGEFIENGIHYECDLVKISYYHLSEDRKPLNPKTVIE